jgi:hypothetical protein
MSCRCRFTSDMVIPRRKMRLFHKYVEKFLGAKSNDSRSGSNASRLKSSGFEFIDDGIY